MPIRSATKPTNAEPEPTRSVLDDPSRAFLSVSEVAQVLGISDRSVRRSIREGQLGAIQFGDRVLVLRQDIVDAVARAFPERYPAHSAILAEEAVDDARDAAIEEHERRRWQRGTPEWDARIVELRAHRAAEQAATEAFMRTPEGRAVNPDYFDGQSSVGVL